METLFDKNEIVMLKQIWYIVETL